MKTIDIRARYRPFRVTYHGPGNVRGARYTIRDLRHGKRRTLPYDYELNSVADMAMAYLARIGIEVNAMALADKDCDCLLLTTDFQTDLR